MYIIGKKTMPRKKIAEDKKNKSCTFTLEPEIYELMTTYLEKYEIKDKSKWVSELLKKDLGKKHG